MPIPSTAKECGLLVLFHAPRSRYFTVLYFTSTLCGLCRARLYKFLSDLTNGFLSRWRRYEAKGHAICTCSPVPVFGKQDVSQIRKHLVRPSNNLIGLSHTGCTVNKVIVNLFTRLHCKSCKLKKHPNKIQWAAFLGRVSPKFTIGRIDTVRSTEEVERRRWFFELAGSVACRQHWAILFILKGYSAISA